MNAFGILVGIITCCVIGLGFPLVIRGERTFGYWCWPYMMGIGVWIVLISLFMQNDWLCVITGVVGATFVWGSTELKEQAVRAELGWYPLQKEKVQLPFASVLKKWKAPHL